ncbi:MAG TPA: FMN-binding protein [Pseudonocardiaceae bacterium]
MSNRRLAGLAGLLAGIGLLVAAKAAGGQPAHQQQAALLPVAPPTTQPATQGTPPPTGGTTAPPAGPHTVDGSVIDTPYGSVQVAVVFDGTKITDVQTKQTPDIDGRSVRLAELATPILRQEVLSAQSAHVDTVSGATYTSDGYAQSVQYAIDHSHG